MQGDQGQPDEAAYVNPRDARSAQILTSRYRVQAWFVLGQLEWPAFSMIGSTHVQTTVPLKEQGLPGSALLLEFDSRVSNLDEPWTADQARLRRMSSRLRVSWCGMPQMIAARLVDMHAGPGDRVMCCICHPVAVGAHEQPVRAPAGGYGLLSNSLLEKELPPATENALSWYLAALDADDPFAEALCLWAAIEALAPAVSKPPTCERCRGEMPPCSACGSSSRTRSVLAGIRDYVVEKAACSRKDINEWYGWRSTLVHGSKDRDLDLLGDAVCHVADVRRLAERLIAIELGEDRWPTLTAHPDFEDPLRYQVRLSCEWTESIFEEPGPLFCDVEVGLVNGGEPATGEPPSHSDQNTD